VRTNIANQIHGNIRVDQNHGCAPVLYPLDLGQHGVDSAHRILVLCSRADNLDRADAADRLARRKIQRLPDPLGDRHNGGTCRALRALYVEPRRMPQVILMPNLGLTRRVLKVIRSLSA
jgi:hypothetical protein